MNDVDILRKGLSGASLEGFLRTLCVGLSSTVRQDNSKSEVWGRSIESVFYIHESDIKIACRLIYTKRTPEVLGIDTFPL